MHEHDIRSKNFTSLSDMISYTPTVSLNDKIQILVEDVDSIGLSSVLHNIISALWEETAYSNYRHHRINFFGTISGIFTRASYNYRYSLNNLIEDIEDRKPIHNSASHMSYYFNK